MEPMLSLCKVDPVQKSFVPHTAVTDTFRWSAGVEGGTGVGAGDVTLRIGT